jgi:translation initiation factor IF-1
MGKRNRQETDSDRDDRLGMIGLVVESNTGLFRVQIEGAEQIVTCQPSGKIRQHKINIVVGDRVKIEMSPYDLTRGRIMFRL